MKIRQKKCSKFWRSGSLAFELFVKADVGDTGSRRKGGSRVRSSVIPSNDGLSATDCVKLFIWHAEHHRSEVQLMYKISQRLMASKKNLIADLSVLEIEVVLATLGKLAVISKAEAPLKMGKLRPFPKLTSFTLDLFREYVWRQQANPQACNILHLCRVVHAVGLVCDCQCTLKKHHHITVMMRDVLDILSKMDWFEHSNAVDWETTSLLFNGCSNMDIWDKALTEVESKWMIPNLLHSSAAHGPALLPRHIFRLLQTSLAAERFHLLSALIPRIHTCFEQKRCDQWDLSVIVMSLRAFNMKCRPGLQERDEQLVTMTVYQIKKQLLAGGDTLHPKSVQSIITGLGQIGVFDPAIHLKLNASILKRINIFSTRQLIDILIGYGNIAQHLTPRIRKKMGPFLDVVVGNLSSNLQHKMCLSKEDISCLWKGMAKLRYVDHTLLECTMDKWLEGHRSGGHAFLIAHPLHDFAYLNVKHRAFLDFVNSWLKKYAAQITTIESATCFLWSLAVLDVLKTDQFLKIVEVVKDLRSHGRCMKVRHYDVIARTYMWMVLSGQIDSRSESTRVQGVMAFVKEAQQMTRRHLKITGSPFEKQILTLLRNLGFSAIENDAVLDGCVVPDFILKDLNMVVEADGPMHYTSNIIGGGRLPLGHTAFRNRMLEAAGYKVTA